MEVGFSSLNPVRRACGGQPRVARHELPWVRSNVIRNSDGVVAVSIPLGDKSKIILMDGHVPSRNARTRQVENLILRQPYFSGKAVKGSQAPVQLILFGKQI